MFPRHLSLFVLAVLLAASLLGGCVPVEHLDASPVAGQVVDRATRRPIVDAKVVLSISNPDREASMQTDAEGRFHFAGFRHVEFIPLPYGFYRAPTGSLRVEAPGYRLYGRNESSVYGAGETYSGLGREGDVLQVRVELVRVGR